ncbi:MAG: hypothetical protein H8D34_16870 [Chloroflexi bacterium]|nr:hypothetical protein [Chloroflexota bacterium]
MPVGQMDVTKFAKAWKIIGKRGEKKAQQMAQEQGLNAPLSLQHFVFLLEKGGFFEQRKADQLKRLGVSAISPGKSTTD